MTTAAAQRTLEIENLGAAYGETQVLWDVSLAVSEGERVALIGSNGAGKSTLLGAISGQVATVGGCVRYAGEELTERSPERIVAAGIIQVPQGRRLFSSLSVRENLLMGAYLRADKEVDSDLERILGLFPRLRERFGYLAGRLSGGEQQMVAIARALMGRPKILMLDEMSLGLAPVLVDQLLKILEEIHAQGVGILMVEQDVQTALEFSTRAYVLETGRVRLAGESSKLLDDPEIKRSYLGV